MTSLEKSIRAWAIQHTLEYVLASISAHDIAKDMSENEYLEDEFDEDFYEHQTLIEQAIEDTVFGIHEFVLNHNP